MASNPHDALFKSVFSSPEHARGALRAIVPPELGEASDWGTGGRALLLRQLRRRFGEAVDAAAEQRIAEGSLADLEMWAERVLTAESLADVLSRPA